MLHGLKKLSQAAGQIMVLLAVLLAVLLVGVRLFGFQVYTVLSSSMEPAYHTGALIYVRATDPALIRVGTPITFRLNSSTVATHRVIEVLPDEKDPSRRLFRTQGDANDVPDGSPVPQDRVLGVPRFSLPYLGYLAVFIQNPPGKYLAIAVCAGILLLAFVPDLFRDADAGQPEPRLTDGSENQAKRNKD